MEKLNLTYFAPKDYSKYFDPDTGKFRLRDIISIDNTRPGYNDKWALPDKVDPAKLPSSIIMDKKIIDSGLPILSVVVDESDLYDARTGIFTNHQEKGKKWERLSFISYYDKGQLLFGTGAGVRVHGGGDRSTKYKGLRFYFRKIYGAEEFKSGILFSKESEPIQRIIVRKEPAFFNAIAFDISRKIGCIAPYTQPVKVYFNGSLYDDHFVLTEHISEDYLFSLFGHDNFIIERTIKRRRPRSKEFIELREWAQDESIRMTMEEVGKKVDIKNLSLWWISQFYVAGKDHYQGTATLDKTRDDAKWFWTNWDMDQSIRNTSEKDKQIWEQELCIDEVMNSIDKLDQKDPRGILFRRMMKEDPAYKTYFETLLMDALNHQLTKEYLESRIEYYEKAGNLLGVTAFEGEDVRLFFKNRPAYLMKLMKKYFHSHDSYPCKVNAPDGVQFEIDGHVYNQEYHGWYFKGSTVSIKMNGQRPVLYWNVNGKKIKNTGSMLIQPINGETVIKPVVS